MNFPYDISFTGDHDQLLGVWLEIGDDFITVFDYENDQTINFEEDGEGFGLE